MGKYDKHPISKLEYLWKNYDETGKNPHIAKFYMGIWRRKDYSNNMTSSCERLCNFRQGLGIYIQDPYKRLKKCMEGHSISRAIGSRFANALTGLGKNLGR